MFAIQCCLSHKLPELPGSVYICRMHAYVVMEYTLMKVVESTRDCKQDLQNSAHFILGSAM